MFVVIEGQECRKCGCTEYPFYAEKRRDKIILSKVCFLCYREDDATKSRAYYRKNRLKVLAYKKIYRQRPEVKKRKNELGREYYRKRSPQQIYAQREVRRLWYQSNKKPPKKRRPHFRVRPSSPHWSNFNFRSRVSATSQY